MEDKHFNISFQGTKFSPYCLGMVVVATEEGMLEQVLRNSSIRQGGGLGRQQRGLQAEGNTVQKCWSPGNMSSPHWEE